MKLLPLKSELYWVSHGVALKSLFSTLILFFIQGSLTQHTCIVVSNVTIIWKYNTYHFPQPFLQIKRTVLYLPICLMHRTLVSIAFLSQRDYSINYNFLGFGVFVLHLSFYIINKSLTFSSRHAPSSIKHVCTNKVSW